MTHGRYFVQQSSGKRIFMHTTKPHPWLKTARWKKRRKIAHESRRRNRRS